MKQKLLAIIFIGLSLMPNVFSQDFPFEGEIKMTNPRTHGNEVIQLQIRLLNLGYSEVGEADGWFGPNTENAVKNLQSDLNLAVTGIVDLDTWEILFNSHTEQIVKTIIRVKEIDQRDNLIISQFNYQVAYENGPGYPVGV